MLDKFSSRHFVLLGMLASVTCLSYFYLLDNFVFTSAYFVPIFQVLLSVYDAQAAWLSLAVCFIAAAWARPAPIVKLVDWISEHMTVVLLVTTTALALASHFVYHRYPFSMDEYAATFQSKIFAAGRLYAELPPSVINWLVMPGFNGSFLVASHETGRAVEGYWPGFALLLAPFQWLGIPELCNAVLAGAATYLIFVITLEITGERRAAGWAVLFTLSSGAFVANAISFYSMQAHLTANLLFAWLLMKPTNRRTFLAGLVGSLALLLHNPLPHTLFAVPWILAMVIDGTAQRRLLPLMLGYLPGVCGVFGWLLFRSHLVPVEHTVAAFSGVGNGVFMLPDSVMLQMRVASLVKLWIWGVPCLLCFALLGCILRRENPAVRLLARSAALTFVAYIFVRLDQGHGWGYRYFHSAWGVLPILAACALGRGSSFAERLPAFAGAAAVLSLLCMVPLQLFQMEGIISRHIAQIPPPRRPGNNVYLIQPGAGSYMSDMIQIDPLLRDRDLLLASRGGRMDAELLRQNWPDAVKVGENSRAQQWYLGDADRRRSVGPGSPTGFEMGFQRPASFDRR
jgi:hypothetical protein